jgi:serine/threonine protein phosphatase 1
VALLNKLRRRPRKTGTPAVPDGLRLYAVGDIHGRADLLAELHDAIAADANNHDGEKRIVYLGDFIDRGMESRQVVDMLLQSPLVGFEAVHLLGNHEHALLNFIDDPESIPGWLSWGGRETLYSYGIKCGLNLTPDELFQLAGELKMVMPRDHVAFLEDAELSHRAGSYYFVHAGVRPGVALDEQRFEDQLWISELFISSDKDHGAVVVHGHTISEQVTCKPNRIGLDTGAYYSGVLSCLVLEGESRRLVQTGGGA